MMKQLKKVLSILCAIALLISSMTFALAESNDEEAAFTNNEQQNDNRAEEEAARKAAEEEAARKAAEEEAARKAAEEEAARKAAEEEAARKAAEEEAARKAAEEEAARKAAEEEAARKAAEEEAARKAAEEEAARKAAEEEAAREAAEGEAADKDAGEETGDESTDSDRNEASDDEEADEEAGTDESGEADSEGLYYLDDNDGYIDREVIEENTPAITDELKGLRDAEMYVGETLSETIRFCDELTVTLKGCDVSTIELALYLPSGASVITKVDGKHVSFTPADSDVPSMNLYTYELANAAGHNHKIVLTTYDETVSFRLAAVVKQVEEINDNEPDSQNEQTNDAEANHSAPEDPAAGENTDETPADEIPTGETPAETKTDAPAETPAPTIQASVKTYNALKVGSSIGDTLIAGQKARIQVKCGKNPYVTLTLNANPDDVNVSIDGDAARFTDMGNGTYSCDLDEVAFRKFTVTITAKKELSFSLTATARQIEEAPAYEENEEDNDEGNNTEEEINEEINKEETEQPAEEPAAEESTEKAEETDVLNKEETEEPATAESADQTEVSEEGKTEESEAPAEEAEESDGEENGEEAEAPADEENAEENKEEGNGEESETPADEENGEESKEEENAEESEEPADEEAESEEETGEEETAPAYTRVTVTAEEGADLYAEASRESEVTGHLEAGAETLVILNEDQTWGRIFTEDEEAAAQFIAMEDVSVNAEEPEEEEAAEEIPEETEEETAPEYIRIVVTAEEGADLYAEASRESEVTGHLEAGAEALVVLNEDQTWGRIFNEDEEAAAQFISMEDAVNAAKKEFEDKLTESGYRKVLIQNRDGADIYDSTEEEAAVIGHADFESKLWIRDAEAEGWAEIFSEEETKQYIRLADIEEQSLTEEEMEALGYRKVQVLNQNGTDIYDSTEEEAAVTGHADFESELWIRDAEAEGWAEIFSEEETKQYIRLADIEKQPLTDEEMEALGYRKVQILNENGTDIYDSTEEEAAVIGHADFESEIWIRDLETEGWAEVYNEEGIQQFVRLDEIGRQMPSDEEMLEAGYIKVYVAIDVGANIFGSAVAYEGEETIGHLEANTELWVKLIDGADRALIFDLDEEAPARYISLVDIIAILKPEGMENLPTRELVVHSSAEGLPFIFTGTTVTLSTELVNFLESDVYTSQWKYSIDGEEFIEIDDANDLNYEYVLSRENADYHWRITVILVTPEKLTEEGTAAE
ncbi:MAG: hypothetical protein K6F61_04470 [Clostridiales bacterium]|nr:hypothetical protein [Clostridiales bacterium]